MWSVTDGRTHLRVAPCSAQGRFYHSAHRWSGRAAILLTLPAAYHCIFLLGFGTHSPRVLIHSLLGSALYGAVVAKVLIVRSTRFAPLGAPRGWRPLVLNPSGAGAGLRALVP